MRITLNITDELIEKANGDLTITLNLKSTEKAESPKPNPIERVTSAAKSFLSGDRSSKSNSSVSFSELNNL